MLALDFANTVVAFLIAVTSASITVTLLGEGRAAIRSGGFESATDNDFFTKSLHLLIMMLALFVIQWFFAFVCSIAPYIVGILVAKLFKISHWLYFVTGSTLTAGALLPVFINMPNLGINVIEPEPSFGQRYLNGLPLFLMSGAAAGLMCWQHLRKKSLPKGREFSV